MEKNEKETKEQKERVTMKIDGTKVTVHHNTKTADGDIWFDTTFDFANVDEAQKLRWLAGARTIAWRASAGVKKLTSAEIREKGLITTTVDCSKTIERVKHVMSEEEKDMTRRVREYMAKGLSFTAAMRAALQDVENEELEAGETLGEQE